MTLELLNNVRLSGIGPHNHAPRRNAEICPGWRLGFSPPGSDIDLIPGPLEGSGSGRLGLRLHLGTQGISARLWQPVDLEPVRNFKVLQLRVKVRRSPGVPTAPLLTWAAVLRAEADGKLVFARYLLKGPHALNDAWSELMGEAELENFEPASYVLALQFENQTGSLDVAEVALTASSAPAKNAAATHAAHERPVAPKPATPAAFAPKAPARPKEPAAPPAAAQEAALSPAAKPAEPPPAARQEARAAPASHPAPVIEPPPTSLPAAMPEASFQRCCVVSWDMAHNPVGRAFLLGDMAARFAEVELVGPMFDRYGTRIWPPIAELGMSMRAFPATNMRSFLEGAINLAKSVKCEVVHIGKARLPSLILGALIRHHNQCPMVVDVDDHELSFFQNRTEATLEEVANGPAEEFDAPYSELWTRHAETLVKVCDGVTVSNYNLQRRFGGVVVRHGRDERLFNPRLYNRAVTRAAFGYGPDDRVVLFLGTPRPHKGVFTIADAMEKLDDRRLALCVIGSINDKRVSNRFNAYKRARIALHPDQPWQRLPELVAMADAVFLLQDPASAIAEYQIPAKLTDALALGVPCYATPVPPLVDLIAAGALIAVKDDAELEAALRDVAAGTAKGPSGRARDYYLTELNYDVNAARLELAFRGAAAERKPDLPAFDALFDLLQKRTGVALPRFTHRLAAPAAWHKCPPDLVFLWKQNDSGIYGRRSDMLLKYLQSSGKVGRILHFDAPISTVDLEKQPQHGPLAEAHQGNLVYMNTLRRVLRQGDLPGLTQRTFLYRTSRQPERMFGMDVPHRDTYPDFLRNSMREAGIGSEPLLWVCPAVFDYQLVREAVQPGLVIADIIDDQRSFKSSETYHKRVVAAYQAILSDADLVLSNCEATKAGFASLRSDINVVPNGAEEFDLGQSWEVPPELKSLPRPLIGYVGNLRDRVDYGLIRAVAQRNPRASVVLVGSAHGRPEVLELGKLGNVHFMGVRPYPEAIRFIRAFDLAMMPHARNELSDNMNPLKLYVYFALGVPIVTTEVANIGDIAPYAAVAGSHEAFLDRVAEALDGKAVRVRAEQREAVLAKVSWRARLADIFDRIAY